MRTTWTLIIVGTLVFFLAVGDALARPGGGARRGSPSAGARAGQAGARVSAPSASRPSGAGQISGARPTTRPTPQATFGQGARPAQHGGVRPPSFNPTGTRPGNWSGMGHGGWTGNVPSGVQLQHHLNWSPAAGAHLTSPTAIHGHLQSHAGVIRAGFAGRLSVRPFTAAWYRQHPRAWQFRYPHADAWAVATWATVANWVGVVAEPVAYGYSNVTYVESGDYAVDDETAATFQEQAQQAAELAAAGGQVDLADAEWLPVGVFALVQGDQTDSNAMVQLAVSKEGNVAGSHYDMLTDSAHDLQGSIDRQAQLVAWTVGTDGGAVFETSLAGLAEDQAPVTVYFTNGQSQKWSIVRMEP